MTSCSLKGGYEHFREICYCLHLQGSGWMHYVLSVKFHHYENVSSHLRTCKCKCFSLEYHLQWWKVNDQHLPYYRQRHCQQEHTVTQQANREDWFGLQYDQKCVTFEDYYSNSTGQSKCRHKMMWQSLCCIQQWLHKSFLHWTYKRQKKMLVQRVISITWSNKMSKYEVWVNLLRQPYECMKI